MYAKCCPILTAKFSYWVPKVLKLFHFIRFLVILDEVGALAAGPKKMEKRGGRRRKHEGKIFLPFAHHHQTTILCVFLFYCAFGNTLVILERWKHKNKKSECYHWGFQEKRKTFVAALFATTDILLFPYILCIVHAT